MRAFIFDTETTGLIDNRSLPLDKQPEIIEFYGVNVDLATGEEWNEIDELIKPKRPPDETITRITGLTEEDLKDKPDWSVFAERIGFELATAPLVIAHNLSFDREMVDIEMERQGKAVTWPALLCTVEATIHLKGFRLNLTDLHTHLFGEGFPKAHRAKNDVTALVRCCVELYKLGEL